MKRTDAEILADLRDVDNQLSPENLTCDGELSAVQVRKRHTALKKQEAKLLKELGREPTTAELYGL